ncbi:unnamed protein product [Vitrella brassicaformis CCMP3155]|uniref:Bromo domain-containing protein n=3 Tax=Vitrella brassicaformis TaxID=1169539 RepID=A0A0G4F7Z7_VITBC|nr:unnamed protein product [Vitrella brassicaformis CCMP3155]|eukprot:CEM08372.1 unnamed protein product [Vitrella brassicaformis CCMP3155]
MQWASSLDYDNGDDEQDADENESRVSSRRGGAKSRGGGKSVRRATGRGRGRGGRRDGSLAGITYKKKIYTFRELLLDLITKLEKRDKDQWFHYSVDAKKYPHYYTTIRNPMDFQTMRRKVDRADYQELSWFENDVNLIITNAKLFNLPHTTPYKAAEVVEAHFKRVIETARGRWNDAKKEGRTFEPHIPTPEELSAIADRPPVPPDGAEAHLPHSPDDRRGVSSKGKDGRGVGVRRKRQAAMEAQAMMGVHLGGGPGVKKRGPKGDHLVAFPAISKKALAGRHHPRVDPMEWIVAEETGAASWRRNTLEAAGERDFKHYIGVDGIAPGGLTHRKEHEILAAVNKMMSCDPMGRDTPAAGEGLGGENTYLHMCHVPSLHLGKPVLSHAPDDRAAASGSPPTHPQWAETKTYRESVKAFFDGPRVVGPIRKLMEEIMDRDPEPRTLVSPLINTRFFACDTEDQMPFVRAAWDRDQQYPSLLGLGDNPHDKINEMKHLDGHMDTSALKAIVNKYEAEYRPPRPPPIMTGRPQPAPHPHCHPHGYPHPHPHHPHAHFQMRHHPGYGAPRMGPAVQVGTSTPVGRGQKRDHGRAQQHFQPPRAPTHYPAHVPAQPPAAAAVPFSTLPYGAGQYGHHSYPAAPRPPTMAAHPGGMHPFGSWPQQGVTTRPGTRPPPFPPVQTGSHAHAPRG